MKYTFYEHILRLRIQRNDIKVYHDVANTDSKLILSKWVPFLVQTFNEYVNSGDPGIWSILVRLMIDFGFRPVSQS